MNCENIKIIQTTTAPNHINELGLCGNEKLTIQGYNRPCLTAFLDDNILGILVYTLLTETGFVEYLCTKNPKCHRVGSLLLKYFEDMCIHMKLKIVELVPLSSSVGFYAKQGYHFDKLNATMIKYLGYSFDEENVNKTFGKGMTGLMIEIEKGDDGNILVYLSLNPDLNIKNIKGDTALEIALSIGSSERIILDLIDISVDIPVNVLFLIGNADMLASRISSKISGIDLMYDGETALMRAAGKGRVDIIFLLLQRGANVNIKDSIGDDALIQAVVNNQIQIASMLLNAGSDVRAQSDDGNTALMLASGYGYLEIVCMLLTAGFDVYHKNVVGETALFKANKRGRRKVAWMLGMTESMGRNELDWKTLDELFESDPWFWTVIAKRYCLRCFEYFVGRYREILKGEREDVLRMF